MPKSVLLTGSTLFSRCDPHIPFVLRSWLLLEGGGLGRLTEQATEDRCLFLTGKAEVHPATVPCHDGWQRDGPDPRQGHLCSHCFPAPQQRGQLCPADPGSQVQLEAHLGGPCLLGLTGFLKNCSFPNSRSHVSVPEFLFSGFGSLPWWQLLI